MSSYKTERAKEEIRKELSSLMRELKDPRITGLLSIVKIDLTNDFAHSTVYISSLEGLEQAQEAVKGLESAAGFIRRDLSRKLRIRRVPNFQFVADDGIAYSASISKMIDELKDKKKGEPDED